MKSFFFGIKSVEEMTGLSQSIIRIWEKRYSAISPIKNISGKKLYSQNDIEKLIIIKKLISQGHNISHISKFELIELKKMYLDNSNDLILIKNEKNILNNLFQIIKDFDLKKFHSELFKVALLFDMINFFQDILLPLSNKLGDLYKSNKIPGSKYFWVILAIRNFLELLRNNLNISKISPKIIISGLKGDSNETEILMACVLATQKNYNVTYLGNTLYASDIISAHEKLKPKITLIGISNVINNIEIKAELKKIRNGIDNNIMFYIGDKELKKDEKNFYEKSNTNIIKNMKEFVSLL